MIYVIIWNLQNIFSNINELIYCKGLLYEVTRCACFLSSIFQ